VLNIFGKCLFEKEKENVLKIVRHFTLAAIKESIGSPLIKVETGEREGVACITWSGSSEYCELWITLFPL
jgi:hypothetical protein